MAELLLPYQGKVKVSSPYGDRTLNGQPDWHNGIDLVGMESKTILAPCDGIVGVSTIITDKSNLTWQWGNYVRIDRSDGMKIYCCHMSRRIAVAGQTVRAGDPIGVEGTTGYSFGSHCHFEVRVNNTAVDPTPYLGILNAVGIYQNGAESPAAAPAPSPAQSSAAPGDGNTPHDWAREAVEWAIAAGILKGSSATNPNYRLNDPVTREEDIVFLYRFAEYIEDQFDA